MHLLQRLKFPDCPVEHVRTGWQLLVTPARSSRDQFEANPPAIDRDAQEALLPASRLPKLQR